LNLFESLKNLMNNKVLLTLEEFFKHKDDALKVVYHIDKIFFKIEVNSNGNLKINLLFFIKKIIEDVEYELDKDKNPDKKALLMQRVKKM